MNKKDVVKRKVLLHVLAVNRSAINGFNGADYPYTDGLIANYSRKDWAQYVRPFIKDRK